MKRTFLTGFLIFLTALVLFSCRAEKNSCEAVFSDFAAEYGNLPAGRLYLKSAKEWQQEYLSKELFESVYTGLDGKGEYEQIEDCAIFLSSYFDSFCEVGVFLCYGNTDTQSVARMCHRRAELVSSLRGFSTDSTDKAVIVQVKGRVVFYCITPENKAAERAARLCLD